jgi:hypothetical protein
LQEAFEIRQFQLVAVHVHAPESGTTRGIFSKMQSAIRKNKGCSMPVDLGKKGAYISCNPNSAEDP